MNHVRNAGRIIAKSEKLPPIFLHAPVAYHGRAGSIVISGTDIQRPSGYAFGAPSPGGAPSVVHGPSKRMDYELELGAVIGKPLPMGQLLTAENADDYIFGFLIVNDWSGKETLLILFEDRY